MESSHLSPEDERSARNAAGQLSPAPETRDTDDLTPASVFYDAAIRFLDIQISTSDTLDSRNASIISISSTVLRNIWIACIGRSGRLLAGPKMRLSQPSFVTFLCCCSRGLRIA